MQRVLVPARKLLTHPGFFVILGCNLLLGLAYSFVAPFMSMFGTLEVGMRPMTFGLFMTLTSFSAVIVSTLLAHWSDTHISRRAMLLIGSGSGLLGYVGYAFVRDVRWLTLIGTTILAVSSITFSQLFAYAREALGRSDVPEKETPLYMNVFRLIFSLAWTAGPAVAAWVMVLYSFRGMFLVAAAMFGLLTLTVWRWVPVSQPAMASRAAHIPLLRVLRRPDLLAYFLGFVLIFAAGTISMMNLPLLVLQTLGGNARQVGVIYSLGPVFELPLLFYFGLLATRGDHGRVIRIGVVIAVAYYALLTLVHAPWQIYPLQILGAAATAVSAGVAITFFQNYLPGQAGTATNLYASAQRIGSMVGYLLFGALDTALGHRAVCGACSSLCAVTLALFLVLHRRTPAVSACPAGLVGSSLR
jgi:SET family sugar efflux transporter-like MFS transporter